MSTLKFYGFNISGPSNLVKAVLLHLNIDHEFEETHPFNDTKTPEHLAMNPYGKIPVIKDGDFILYESIAIARYLARSQAASSFYPHDDAQKAAHIDSLIDYDVQTFRKACLPFAPEMFFGPKFKGTPEPTEERKVELQKGLDDAFGLIADILKRNGTPYLAGDEPTLADFTVFYSTIPEIKMAGGKYDTHSEFAEWYEKVSSLPAVAKTLEDFEAKFATFFSS